MDTKDTENYMACRERTERLNLELGLIASVLHYDHLHHELPEEFTFPDFLFDTFTPPFGLLSELDFTFSHINVILSGPFVPSVHGALFNSRKLIDEKSMRFEFDKKKAKKINSDDYIYHPSQRLVNHLHHPDLWKVLLGTECASITEMTDIGSLVSFYNAKIRANDEDVVKKVMQRAERLSPADHAEYLRTDNHEDRLWEKIYESIAWSGLSGGTKRFAAASFLYACPDDCCTVDIISKTGIYTRMEKTPSPIGDGFTVTHVIPQRRVKFEETVPKEYEIGESEKFVLHCVRYRRNGSYSLNSSWVDVVAEWIANPQDLSIENGILTDKLKAE